MDDFTPTDQTVGVKFSKFCSKCSPICDYGASGLLFQNMNQMMNGGFL